LRLLPTKSRVRNLFTAKQLHRQFFPFFSLVLALWRASSIHVPHSFLFFGRYSPALRTSAHPVIAGSAPLGIKLPKAGIVAKVSKRPNEALQQPFVFDADLLAFNDVHGSDNDVCGCSGDVLSSSYTHSWQQPQGESLNPAP
jgi:hypothetical protein